MIIYRCENICSCKEEFDTPDKLHDISMVVGEKTIEYALCDNCTLKLQKYFEKFFELKPEANLVTQVAAK